MGFYGKPTFTKITLGILLQWVPTGTVCFRIGSSALLFTSAQYSVLYQCKGQYFLPVHSAVFFTNAQNSIFTRAQYSIFYQCTVQFFFYQCTVHAVFFTSAQYTIFYQCIVQYFSPVHSRVFLISAQFSIFHQCTVHYFLPVHSPVLCYKFWHFSFELTNTSISLCIQYVAKNESHLAVSIKYLIVLFFTCVKPESVWCAYSHVYGTHEGAVF